MNPSRATIPLIRPHQCDSEGGRIRGVLLYVESPFSNADTLTSNILDDSVMPIKKVKNAR